MQLSLSFSIIISLICPSIIYLCFTQLFFQEQHLDLEEVSDLVRRFEPDTAMRSQCFMSFEGFARMLMDKENYAHIYEKSHHTDEVTLSK